MLQTDFEFELPRGFVDTDGNLHREGSMPHPLDIPALSSMC